MSAQQDKAHGQMQLMDIKHGAKLLPYPIDVTPFLTLLYSAIDAAGVPYQVSPRGYHPTAIAQYALAHWNAYLATAADSNRNAFLTQANWLIEHEVRIGENAGGWPISFPRSDFYTSGSWLSASTQGNVVSVLVRAYQMTGQEIFLQAARRAVCTFELDILDGGVNIPIGENGVFFEEVGVYPAAHTLNGFFFALFGLYDYVALTNNIQVEKLIQNSLDTLHTLLVEYDAGFWTRSELLHRRLASPSEHALQVVLLEALANYSGCDHCLKLAFRWKGYQRQLGSRLRYLVASRCSYYGHALWKRVQAALFPKFQASSFTRVCVPLPSFPVTGGVLTILEGITQVTANAWQLEYLTQYVGSEPERFVIHRFSTAKIGPWYFPLIWLYVLAGWWKLISLVRHGAGYQIILPQDGVFTGAFAALAAKLAGVRVVCIDHANLTYLENRIYRVYQAERIAAMARKNWHWTLRLVVKLLFRLYRPSFYLLARISARFVDHFLVPGIPGDGVEEICQRLGIQQHRVTRFASMMDVDRHILPAASLRARMREKIGLASDDIVITIVCRLAPEKGLDIALASISQALTTLSPEMRNRVRVVIAGDGPLRRQVEEDIRIHDLSQTCLLWGETPTAEVLSLLSLSDIFLYTSKRGACFAMAVLEAMASGCAVIASTEPMSNARLLAEGRGIAVPANDIEQTALALVQLVNDLELCHRMGRLARNYIAQHHSPVVFKRTLLRATCWSALDEILAQEKKTQAAATIVGERES